MCCVVNFRTAVVLLRRLTFLSRLCEAEKDLPAGEEAGQAQSRAISRVRWTEALTHERTGNGAVSVPISFALPKYKRLLQIGSKEAQILQDFQGGSWLLMVPTQPRHPGPSWCAPAMAAAVIIIVRTT